MSIVDRIKSEIKKGDYVNELSALLRYSQVPTLVVEGSKDIRIYNMWIGQHLLDTYKVDVLAAHGRDNLFRLYERQSEFVHAPVIFIADQEMLSFSWMPKLYEDIVWTQGYSIENEIYSNGRIERLIQYNPTIEYDRVKDAVIKWFAYEVDEYFETRIQREAPNLDELILEGETELNEDFLKKRGFDRPPKNSTINNIKENYLLELPGKLLFQMLERASGITFDGLYNTALVNYDAQSGIIGRIRRKLDEKRLISSQEFLSKPEEQKPPEKDQKLFLLENKSISKSESLVGRLVRKETVIKGDNADILKELMKQDKMKFNPITTMTSRDDLLSIYSKGKLSIYVVDREMRVFSETPERYLNVIWTKGYSLENDFYIGGGLGDLIAHHEKWKHRQVLNATIKWFAFEVEEFMQGRTFEMDVELSDIVEPGQLKPNKKFREENNFREPSAELIQHIRKDYKRLLPGKFLFQILIRFLNTRGRSYNYEVTYESLFDIALSGGTQQTLDELVRQIKTRLREIERKISSPIKVGDNVYGKILNKKGPTFTVQLETKNKENIPFEQNDFPIKVEGNYKFKVTALDYSDRITEVEFIPPREPKANSKIRAKIIENTNFKLTVQLMTKNEEIFTFKGYFPRIKDEETIVKVDSIDPSTGEVTKATFKGLQEPKNT